LRATSLQPLVLQVDAPAIQRINHAAQRCALVQSELEGQAGAILQAARREARRVVFLCPSVPSELSQQDLRAGVAAPAPHPAADKGRQVHGSLGSQKLLACEGPNPLLLQRAAEAGPDTSLSTARGSLPLFLA